MQQWFLTEPLLFAAWTTHQVTANPSISTIRVGKGQLEYNNDFIRGLDKATLREVMKFETLRIILKHPYERRKPNVEFALTASNISIFECLNSSLPMPSAEATFDDDKHNKKYFEYYYNLLVGRKRQPSESNDRDKGGNDKDESQDAKNENQPEEENQSCESEDDPSPNDEKKEGGDSNCDSPCPCGGDCKPGQCKNGGAGKGNSGDRKSKTDGQNGQAKPQMHGTYEAPSFNDQPPKSTIPVYCDATQVCIQNANHWDQDLFVTEQINDLITEIEASDRWGTVAGLSRELILASRIPKLDYRKVLKSFRANVLSTQRRLTRMKPSRRYGFAYMGSRRDFTTKILFAIDVSGSVGTVDIGNALSVVNRLFKYGIESVDVLWFDSAIRCEKPITMNKARREVAVTGRGGTNFQPIMNYLDKHRDYDGLIIFTDGIAPVPESPKKNRRTRIAWLFNNERNWKKQHKLLQKPGMVSAFIYAN